MATTSEIQVTEAYIGLLGRAPDPAGLAYWAAELDAAVAAGEDPAVALKKLTNDITLSDEWDSGIGANDASTETGSEAVVTSMYNNLFQRTASDAELEYWAPKLVSGEFTASEMAVALIQGAGTTDASVLGYKQEAATYYVENVAQDDFTQANAGTAVSSVDGPRTLESSKEATDILASGEGVTVALTTANDTVAVTLGDDTVTGVFGSDATFGAGDTMLDQSEIDSDTITLTGDAATLTMDGDNFSNIETMNIAVSKTVGSGFTIALSNNDVDAEQVNISASSEVEVAGLTVAGETVVQVTGNDFNGDISTDGVTSLTLAGLAGNTVAQTITGDADLATVVLADANDAGVTIDLANNDTTVDVTGGGAGNDVVSVSGNGDMALTLTAMEFVNVSGNTGAIDVAVTGTATKYTVSGDQDVTLTGIATAFDGSELVNSATGDVNLVVNGASNDLDLSDFAAITSVELASSQAGNDVTVNDGQAMVISAGQGAGVTILDADGGNDATLAITIDGGTSNSLALGAVSTNDFATVTINAGDNTLTAVTLDTTGGNDGDLTLVSTNDVSGASITAAATTVDVGDLTLTAGITAAGELVVTSDEGVGAATAITSNDGGVTITAGDDITVAAGGIAASAGAGNDVVLSATDLAITGNVVGDDITISASNDATGAAESITGNVTAGNDVTISDGALTITGNLTATAGGIEVTGDTDLTVTGTTAAADNIVITSTGDTDLSSVDGQVLVASASSGDVVAQFDSVTATGTVTIATGAGNDTITMDDSNLFTANLGAGADVAVLTTTGNSSVINTAAGDDTVTMNDVGNDTVVDTGAGDDTISFNDSGTDGVVIRGGDDNDSFTNTELVTAELTLDGGDGTDTLTLVTGDYNDGELAFSNFEKVNISAAGGNVNMSAAQFAGDNTFELISDGTGNNHLVINAETNNDTTVDASQVTSSIASVGDIDINGAGGNDTLTGNATINVIDGGNGDDTISGGQSADTLTGGAGNDTVHGGDGGDTIEGGAGNDTLYGNAGNDSITTNDGADVLYGGDGTDTFVINSTTGNDADITTYVTIADGDFSAAGDNDQITLSNRAGGGGETEANGASFDDLDDLITAANVAMDTTNDVYIVWDAYGSGNGILLVDDDNDGTFEDGETMIVLTGVNTATEANDIGLDI